MKVDGNERLKAGARDFTTMKEFDKVPPQNGNKTIGFVHAEPEYQVARDYPIR